MLKKLSINLAAVGIVLACLSSTLAVNIETVPVGNPGNTGELSGVIQYGTDRICGAVDYEYNIGKYEVTAGQYTAFLNAVADTDTYGLYNSEMWSSDYGCKIRQFGLAGSYTYSVTLDWCNRPVNYVSWGDAARFANWLHNGQPIGAQDLSTTEDGSYYLDGAMSDDELLAITREPDATWVIPSEDEWYKAAYHKNDGVTGNYWEYPTSSDSTPSNALTNPDGGNNANYFYCDMELECILTIGAPYWRTEVGEFENSESPYGTFDQGGNVYEWNEAIVYDACRGCRGSCFYDGDVNMEAWARVYFHPTFESSLIGFRVACGTLPTTLNYLVYLIGRFGPASLSKELKTSLISKVQAADRQATKGKIGAAVNKLKALKNEVEAQRGKKIADGTASMLVDYTDTLIAQLQD